jgi:4-diphosphocytidyl-2-C-methyl-D-erythritol kinase
VTGRAAVGERSAAEPARWPAPAKLNLFLHVTGRRADGYHELQTLFQLIDLCDEITLSVREDGRIERPIGPQSIPAEEDLAWRAAHALQKVAGVGLGAGIEVRKRIPLGAGLGGGSSDAATTLLALNELWDCGLSPGELAQIGLKLGADVPVFVEGFSAWAEGVGERLTPVSIPPAWYVVIYPGVGISTRDVFQSPELTRNSPLITIRAFFESGGRNDCEPVVRARSAEIAEALEWLGRWAPARLTGTGSCVFTACPSAAEAERLAGRVPDRWQSYVARGLDTSPLHQLLQRRRRA